MHVYTQDQECETISLKLDFFDIPAINPLSNAITLEKHQEIELNALREIQLQQQELEILEKIEKEKCIIR